MRPLNVRLSVFLAAAGAAVLLGGAGLILVGVVLVGATQGLDAAIALIDPRNGSHYVLAVVTLLPGAGLLYWAQRLAAAEDADTASTAGEAQDES